MAGTLITDSSSHNMLGVPYVRKASFPAYNVGIIIFCMSGRKMSAVSLWRLATMGTDGFHNLCLEGSPV